MPITKPSITFDRWLKSGAFILLGVSIGAGLMSLSMNEKDQFKKAFKNDYRIYSPPLPDTLSFAGEKVRLEDREIKERLDRELTLVTYKQSSTLAIIKRSSRWLPLIEQILVENGIPTDLKYIPVIESDLLNVISPADAKGFWQMLKGAGQEFGLEISEEIDQRYDPLKATYAACGYLKKAYQRFGSWSMAAASYNMGMYGLAKQTDIQDEKTFDRLWLNEETARYLPRLWAIKLILENPRDYGFYLSDRDMYSPLDLTTVAIDSSVSNWVELSKQFNLSYKDFRSMNPWIRKHSLLNPTKKRYYVRIKP
jgi:hypothetical protein